MKVILNDIEPEDYVLAAKLVRRFCPQDGMAIFVFDDGREFFIKRTKTGVTICECKKRETM